MSKHPKGDDDRAHLMLGRVLLAGIAFWAVVALWVLA